MHDFSISLFISQSRFHQGISVCSNLTHWKERTSLMCFLSLFLFILPLPKHIKLSLRDARQYNGTTISQTRWNWVKNTFSQHKWLSFRTKHPLCTHVSLCLKRALSSTREPLQKHTSYLQKAPFLNVLLFTMVACVVGSLKHFPWPQSRSQYSTKIKM